MLPVVTNFPIVLEMKVVSTRIAQLLLFNYQLLKRWILIWVQLSYVQVGTCFLLRLVIQLRLSNYSEVHWRPSILINSQQ